MSYAPNALAILKPYSVVEWTDHIPGSDYSPYLRLSTEIDGEVLESGHISLCVGETRAREYAVEELATKILRVLNRRPPAPKVQVPAPVYAEPHLSPLRRELNEVLQRAQSLHHGLTLLGRLRTRYNLGSVYASRRMKAAARAFRACEATLREWDRPQPARREQYA